MAKCARFAVAFTDLVLAMGEYLVWTLYLIYQERRPGMMLFGLWISLVKRDTSFDYLKKINVEHMVKLYMLNIFKYRRLPTVSKTYEFADAKLRCMLALVQGFSQPVVCRRYSS